MIAPLDIGMEQHDAALGLGQDDVFDLGRTENGLGKSSRAQFLTDDNGDIIVESDEEGKEGGKQDRGVDVMDLEEEREEKLRDLEVELDDLYNAYQGRLRERDAKFKVNEARRKNTEREEWNGIQEQHSDESESEEGGWERMQDAKLNDGNSSSEDSEASSITIRKRKRKRTESVGKISKRSRLIIDLKQPTSGETSNAAAQVWFSQDMFTGLEDLNNFSDSDDADNDDDDTSEDDEAEASVRTCPSNVLCVRTQPLPRNHRMTTKTTLTLTLLRLKTMSLMCGILKTKSKTLNCKPKPKVASLILGN